MQCFLKYNYPTSNFDQIEAHDEDASLLNPSPRETSNFQNDKYRSFYRKEFRPTWQLAMLDIQKTWHSPIAIRCDGLANEEDTQNQLQRSTPRHRSSLHSECHRWSNRFAIYDCHMRRLLHRSGVE